MMTLAVILIGILVFLFLKKVIAHSEGQEFLKSLRSKGSYMDCYPMLLRARNKIK